MAQIPDSIPLSDVSAPAVAPRGINPTDFGLTEAAQPLAQAASRGLRAQMMDVRAQAAIDRQAAQPYFQKYAEEAQTDAATRLGAWDGSTPGVASDLIQANRAIGKKYSAIDGLSPGVQGELNHLVQAQGNEIGAHAISYEADRIGQLRAQQTADSQALQVDQSFNAANSLYQPAALALKQNWKPGDPPLEDQMGQLYDKYFGPAIAGLPEGLQPLAQHRSIGDKQGVIADAIGYSVKTANDKMLQGVSQQGDVILNTIGSNPAYYDQAVNTDLPSLVAKLPRGLQADAVREFNSRAAAARIQGLIQHGQPMQAYKELQAGTYDKIFDDKTKSALVASTTSAVRAQSPVTADQIVANHKALDSVDAEVSARLNGQTTGLNLGALDGVLSQSEIAGARIKLQTADQLHTVMGSVSEMTMPQLQAAAVQPDPEPSSDPDYPAKLQAIHAQRALAAQELQARQTDPAANLFDTSKKGPPTKGVGATSAGFQRATALNQQWTQVTTASGKDQAQAASDLSMTSLGTQAAQGVPEVQRKVIPQAYASQVAQQLFQAPSDQKLAAFGRVGALIQSFPAAVKLPDGSWSHPQQILVQQLRAAGLNANDVSALVDFGSDPAKMGRYVDAVNNPKLPAKPSPQDQKEIQQVSSQVTTALQPFLDVASPLPGSDSLYQARIARSVLVARSLMANGSNMRDAVKAATSDLTSGYRYVDGWRMPEALAGGVSFNATAPAFTSFAGFQDGAGLARAGAAKALASLTGNNGANLARVGGEDPRLTAARLSNTARWVSSPDDSGLMLMVPHPGAPFEQVRDLYGRPVSLTWQQLQTFGRGSADPASVFSKPPPSAMVGGQAVPAYSRQQVFRAFSDAIVNAGERSSSGAVSSAGALGRWQVMPDTVKWVAPQLGLPVDLERARSDDGYNQRVGSQALAITLNHYATTPGPGGYALAAAAYNAGMGNVDHWIAQYGDPRSGRISVDDWVKKIPFKETRDYVGRVLPDAVRRLKGS